MTLRGRRISVPGLLRPVREAGMLLALMAGGMGAHGQEVVQVADSTLRMQAARLAQELIIVDTHIDLPSRLLEGEEDVSVRTQGGDFDYVRARSGGLDVAFMSIYIPSDFEGTDKGPARAEAQMKIVRALASKWPDKFAVVTSPDDVQRQAGKGKVLLAMGMENGGPLQGDLSRVQYYHGQGIRYITLAHAKNNHICDASYDTTRTWNGLSPFGKTVIGEMNRVGIMIDVSHITDSAFYQVIRLSKAPVIASHSSCRSFTPGFERNMDDTMIRLLAAHGGVIQINFGSSFISNDFRLAEERREREIDRHLKETKVKPDTKEGQGFARQYRHDHPVARPSVRDVAVHIDHVVKIAGVDCVGLGSDFDGVGDTLPLGLQDVADYPNLLAELLRLGYSKGDLKKICGGNLLRVWKEVERVAHESGGM
jgi:membrane dipeptidase